MKTFLVVVSLAFGCCCAYAAPTIVTDDKRVDSLIVLFATGAASAPSPADVIESVIRITAGESVDDKTSALFTRLGAPLFARWLVEYRFTPTQAAIMAESDKESPDTRLQQYVLLQYADADTRATAQRQLSIDSGVHTVVPNHVYDRHEAFASRPNDTYVATGPAYSPQGYQWGLEAIKSISPYSNPSLPSGRDLANGHAYVGIVDTGIDTGAWTGGLSVEFADSFRAHFSQSFYSGACTATTNLTDVDEAGNASPEGCHNTYIGHGTHVAGIIGAKANNATGIAGVCPTCSLIIAKTYQNNNSTAGDLLNGFLHSVYRGAQVINRSGAPFYLEATYGAGVHTCAQVRAAGYANAWCDALDSAEARSVIVVAASGNDNLATSTGFPANERNVVSVAATTYTDALWTNDGVLGSNLGKVEYVAPGRQVVSTFYRGGTWNTALGCADTLDGAANNGFDQCTGTSMAAPHVAGVFAVVRSVSPLLSRAQTHSLVSTTARVVAGAGNRKMPDQYAAITQAITGNNSITPMFAMVNRVGSADWNRYFTTAPQMAAASIAGTMLPTSVSPLAPVTYIPDPNAPAVAGYPTFPGASGTPRAYFKVWTRPVVGGITMLPLYRLSKLQDDGDGTDACGFAPPVASKPYKVIHVFSTSDSEKASLMGTTVSGTCFKFDGIEGYVAPYNTGGLQPLYRAVSLAANAWILVPGNYLGIANTLGFTSNQSIIGWVISN